MIEDNTPTVTARRRKPTRHMRLRLETARKLRVLGAKRKAAKERGRREKDVVFDSSPNLIRKGDESASPSTRKTCLSLINTRAPKVKKATLSQPAVPKAKFRKRQIHKSWLPTHLFHAKRAHMTPPSSPLWRFSIPLSPTAKSYRPTHRASRERGAVAWDMSYMSTIGLEGREDSVIVMLKAMGVSEAELVGRKGEKWRYGTRVLDTFVYEREAPNRMIAPVSIIWCVSILPQNRAIGVPGSSKIKRKVWIRVHPSAFFELWEEVLRLAKVAKPEVSVEDLRFEIGSIEITGPAATEALLGALWPTESESYSSADGCGHRHVSEGDANEVGKSGTPTVGKTWTSLAGVTNLAILPQNALIAFNVQDPRLHYPPRTVNMPKTEGEHSKLIETIANWPIDSVQGPPDLFDRRARLAASKMLPSQRAINRRKGLAAPGQYPAPSDNDPKIPLLLYVATNSRIKMERNQSANLGSWTLLLPWKCVRPVWYSLMYYPLSTGGQPRFGGLDQLRQLAFEEGRPWFPADCPGTKAGWSWEAQQRIKREEDWKKRPKGKRIQWDAVDLGDGKKGEVGIAWACDWKILLRGLPNTTQISIAEDIGDHVQEHDPSKNTTEDLPKVVQPPQKPPGLVQIPARQGLALLNSWRSASPSLFGDLNGALITVNLTLITRGAPETCARIYRLPSKRTHPALRAQWLALLPVKHPKTRNGPKHSLPRPPKDAPPHVVQQRLAQALIYPVRAGQENYPACPPDEDLIGFVTSGNYNMAAGRGTGVGNIAIEKVLGELKTCDAFEERLCVVRNAGSGIGRLARWNICE